MFSRSSMDGVAAVVAVVVVGHEEALAPDAIFMALQIQRKRDQFRHNLLHNLSDRVSFSASISHISKKPSQSCSFPIVKSMKKSSGIAFLFISSDFFFRRINKGNRARVTLCGFLVLSLMPAIVSQALC